MNQDQIRAVLAPLCKGQSTVFKSPELILTVNFDGDFIIDHESRDGKSGGIFRTPSLKVAVQHIAESFKPAIGQVYQHINGNIYSIIAIANEYSERPEYPPTVVYAGENKRIWAKPLDNFQRKMTRIK